MNWIRDLINRYEVWLVEHMPRRAAAFLFAVTIATIVVLALIAAVGGLILGFIMLIGFLVQHLGTVGAGIIVTAGILIAVSAASLYRDALNELPNPRKKHDDSQEDDLMESDDPIETVRQLQQELDRAETASDERLNRYHSYRNND